MKLVIKSFYKYLTCIGIALILLAAFCVAHKTCGFYYAVNDDVTMQGIASKGVTELPEGRLIFIRYALGIILATLFKSFPAYDWYGILLLGLLFLCYFLVLNRIFTITSGKTDCWWIRIGGIIFIIFLFIDSALTFQFTVVSGVSAATAIFLLISQKDNMEIRNSILVVILLSMACLIRIKVFYMVFPMMVFVITCRLVKELGINGREIYSIKKLRRVLKTNKRYYIKIMLPMLLGLAIFEGIAQIEKDAYIDSPWKEYKEYIHYRSLIQDYYGWPDYYNNESLWDELDISTEEYDCLGMYGILPNMDEKKITAIAKYAELSYDVSFSERLHGMQAVFLNAVKSYDNRCRNILLIISFVMLLGYGISRKNKMVWLGILFGVSLEFAMLIYLLYRGRLPERVVTIYDYQCIMAIMGLLLSNIHQGHVMNRRLFLKIGCVVWLICVVLSINISAKQKRESIEMHKANMVLQQEERDYLEQHRDKFFVVATSTFKTAKRFTLKDVNNRFSNTMGTYGWNTYSPWMNTRLKKLGLNLKENILLSPMVYMMTADLDYADRLNRYYISENWIDCDYEVVDTKKLSDGRTIYVVKWYPKTIMSAYPDASDNGY